jgi:hypothetical protein
MPETPITFDDVERLSDTGLGGQYRINGRMVFIGNAVPMAGTTVCAVGRVGRLVLPRWFAQEQGLTPR